MNEEPTPDAEKIAGAILAASDPMYGAGGGWDLVAKHHAEEISSGLRDIGGAIGDAFTHLEPSATQSGSTVRFDPVNITGGLLAVARALERIAKVMEKRP